MTLLKIIRKKKIATATATATAATPATDKPVLVPSVAKVASVAVADNRNEKIDQQNIEIVRTWLYRIDESEEDHHLVLDKCRRDPEAMQYFLKHTRGEHKTNNE